MHTYDWVFAIAQSNGTTLLKIPHNNSTKVPFGSMCEEKKGREMEYYKRTANAQFMKSCVGCQLHCTLNPVNELTWWIVTANGV